MHIYKKPPFWKPGVLQNQTQIGLYIAKLCPQKFPDLVWDVLPKEMFHRAVSSLSEKKCSGIKPRTCSDVWESPQKLMVIEIGWNLLFTLPETLITQSPEHSFPFYFYFLPRSGASVQIESRDQLLVVVLTNCDLIPLFCLVSGLSDWL